MAKRTLNDALLDKLLLLQHALEGEEQLAAEAVAKDITKRLQTYSDEMVDLFQGLSLSNSDTDAKLAKAVFNEKTNKLGNDLRSITLKLRSVIEHQLNTHFDNSLNWTGRILKQEFLQFAGEQIDVLTPFVSETEIGAMVSERVGGLEYQERLRASLGPDATNKLQGIVDEAYIEATPPRVLAATIKHELEMTGTRAIRIARTEQRRIQALAQQRVYQANQHLLTGQMWVATLERRTCPRCASIDRKVYWYTPVPEGEDGIGEMPRIPLHPLCRCVASPVTKHASELGLPPGTRASIDGQVPSTTDYQSWFNGQSETFQKKWLGPTRFSLYQRGDLTIRNMATPHKVLTLDDWRAAGVL